MSEAVSAPVTVAKPKRSGRRVVVDCSGNVIEQACSRCKRILPASAFGRNKRFEGGIAVECKECARARAQGFYKLNHADALFEAVRRRAVKRGLAFTLTTADIRAAYARQNGRCIYSGSAFGPVGTDTTPSIDRVDSSKGYTPDNIVLCCFWVNVMKTDYTVPEFLARARLLVDRTDTITTDPAIAPHIKDAGADGGVREFTWFHKFRRAEVSP